MEIVLLDHLKLNRTLSGRPRYFFISLGMVIAVLPSVYPLFFAFVPIKRSMKT